MLSELWQRTRHYWYVALIGTLLSLLAGGVVLSMVPPSYEATRSLLFVPSPTSENPREPVNPFFSYLTDSLATSISVMSIILNDERAQDRIAPEGSGIDYSAGQSLDSTAPVLEIAATAPSMQTADAVADQLVDLANQTIAEQQAAAGAPKRTWIRTSLISSSIEPERVWSKAARFAVATFALGVLATFALMSALWHRREVRSRRRGPASGSAQATAVEPSVQPEALSNLP